MALLPLGSNNDSTPLKSFTSGSSSGSDISFDPDNNSGLSAINTGRIGWTTTTYGTDTGEMYSDIKVHDPISKEEFKSEKSYMQIADNSINNDSPNPRDKFYYVHNVWISQRFIIRNHNVNKQWGYPLQLSSNGKTFYGRLVNVAVNESDPHTLRSKCTIIVSGLSALDFAEVVDEYKKKQIIQP